MVTYRQKDNTKQPIHTGQFGFICGSQEFKDLWSMCWYMQKIAYTAQSAVAVPGDVNQLEIIFAQCKWVMGLNQGIQNDNACNRLSTY